MEGNFKEDNFKEDNFKEDNFKEYNYKEDNFKEEIDKIFIDISNHKIISLEELDKLFKSIKINLKKYNNTISDWYDKNYQEEKNLFHKKLNESKNIIDSYNKNAYIKFST